MSKKIKVEFVGYDYDMETRKELAHFKIKNTIHFMTFLKDDVEKLGSIENAIKHIEKKLKEND